MSRIFKVLKPAYAKASAGRQVQDCTWLLAYTLIVIMNVAPLLVQASPSPKDEINVTSDKLLLKKNSRTATFKGSVVIHFKDIKLSTSELQVTYKKVDGKEKIDKIVIPNRLKAVKSCANEVVVADRGVYDADQGKLTLTGKVTLEREKNILRTDELVYYTDIKKSID